MEFLDGITLKQYIDTQGLLTPAEILDLMAPLMEALDEVHNVGLIHRDISPDNIMLLENGGVKLMDFGAARAYTEFGEKESFYCIKTWLCPRGAVSYTWRTGRGRIFMPFVRQCTNVLPALLQ